MSLHVNPAPVSPDSGEYRRRVDILDEFDSTRAKERATFDDKLEKETHEDTEKSICNFNSHTNPGMFFGVGAVGRHPGASDLPWLRRKLNGKWYTQAEYAKIGA